MSNRRVRLVGPLVLAASLASLGGWAPVRTVEQLPAFLLAPLESLLAGWYPQGPDAIGPGPRGLARTAWESWEAAVWGHGRVGPGRRPLLARVTGVPAGRNELRAEVPAGRVALGAAASHRDALVGFVGALEPGGREGTETAVIALLGTRGGRAVAAEWRLAPEARPVSFLVAGRADDGRALRVEGASSTLRPPRDTPAFTRDVAALGDALPAGLLVGLFDGPREDEPGGGLLADSGEVRLRPAVVAEALDLVVLEAEPGEAPAAPARPARLFATARATGRGRLDAGRRDGVAPGDVVRQDGLYVGRVTDAGPGSSIVDLALPAGTLLVVAAGGEVVSCTVEPGSWPRGWQPQRGDLVVWGSLGPGGLVVGAVSGLDDDGRLLVLRPEADPLRAVTVGPP